MFLSCATCYDVSLILQKKDVAENWMELISMQSERSYKDNVGRNCFWVTQYETLTYKIDLKKVTWQFNKECGKSVLSYGEKETQKSWQTVS